MDYNNPIIIALIALFIVFLISLILLSSLKPRWVQITAKNSKLIVCWELVLAYSITFGLVCGTGVMLIMYNNNLDNNNYNLCTYVLPSINA